MITEEIIMAKTKVKQKLSYTISVDLVEYAETHDSDEAEALLDIAEQKDADAIACYKAAKAFFARLVLEEILDKEDYDDMVGAPPAKADDQTTGDAIVDAVDGSIDNDELLAKAETLTDDD